MRFLFTVFVLVGFGSVASQAQIERQHDAHIHGQGQASLAFDGARWTLFLELPGFNVVGFEHPPNNTQQQQTLDAASEYLKRGAWLEFNPQSGCQIADIKVHSLGYAATDHDAHHEHDEAHNHHHDNDHGHAHQHEDEDQHDHARFEIEARGECDDINRLSGWTVGLFDDFRNNESITVAVLTQSQAFEVVLTPNQQRIEFE